MKLQQQRLEQLFQSLNKKRIAILGDIMLDKYLWGNVSRISPEAPVPIVEVDKETCKLGGAANVANNIKSLGGEPVLVGVVGNDSGGDEMRKILEEQQCTTTGIITDNERTTTIKTRIIAHHQHIVRIDNEHKHNISSIIERKVLDFLEKNISSLDGIIIEDYNKGFVVKTLIQEVINIARKNKKIITIDPKFNNFFEYKNVTVFKPNTKEVEGALGTKLTTDESILSAGKMLLEKLNAENILLTRSEKGMTLFEKNGTVTHIPTQARDIADVSGAGDTVIATLTMFLASGAKVQEASFIANYAGGIVCQEVGVVPIEKEKLKSVISSQ